MDKSFFLKCLELFFLPQMRFLGMDNKFEAGMYIR